MAPSNFSNSSDRSNQICRRVLITGRVQGVGYRYTTQEQALVLSIVGWVRNLPDGRVEAMVEGDPAQVDEMIQWFHNGPAGARVRAVVMEDQPLQKFEQFEIRR
jgi:acylphosphatase